MTDFIYANRLVVGEDAGTTTIEGRNQKLKTQTDIIADDKTAVISFNDSTNTIDFHNKSIVNFSGGGSGGGDAYLAGGTGLTTPQVFTGFNRFTNDLQLQDHLLFSDDGITEKAKISSSANEMKILTDTATDIISMKLGNGGSTNTLELKQDPLASTQNGLFLRQNGSGSTLDKVLTNSLQDLGVIVDSVEVSPNTFTNTNTFSTTVNTNGISNTGIIASTSSIATNQSISAGQTITGNELISNGNVTCGVGSNFIVGTTQIASGNLSDFSSLLNTSATQQIKTGNLIVGQLSTSAGVLNFDTTGGANIVNNTGSNTLTTSTTNISDSITWRLGTTGIDSLILRYDANGGGVGVGRYYLEMLDPSTNDYFQLNGNSGYDVANLIALLNNTSLTFNPTTTLSAQGTVLLNGTTTLASGATDIGKSGVTYGVFGKLASLSDRSDTDLNPVRVIPTLVSPLTASAAPFQAPTYVYNRKGTNGSSVPIYEVVINGNVTKSTNWDGNGDQLIFTLPVNFRPSGRITYRAQSRGGRSASRVDITTAGEVLFIDGGGTSTTYTELSLSGMSFYANI